MGSYAAEYSSEAFSQLQGISKTVARRIIKKVETTRGNPHIFFKRLTGRPEYKLRVGDYRLLADVDEARRIIFIRAIGHRRDVYRKTKRNQLYK